jgi:MFS family permease
LSSFTIGAGFGIVAFVNTLPAYVASVVVFTLGEILMAGLSPTIVGDLAPTHLRGTYQGAFHMAFGLASFVGPWASGIVLQAYGSQVLWLACFAVGAAGAAAHLLIAGPRRRRFEDLRAAATPIAAID